MLGAGLLLATTPSGMDILHSPKNTDQDIIGFCTHLSGDFSKADLNMDGQISLFQVGS